MSVGVQLTSVGVPLTSVAGQVRQMWRVIPQGENVEGLGMALMAIRLRTPPTPPPPVLCVGREGGWHPCQGLGCWEG